MANDPATDKYYGPRNRNSVIDNRYAPNRHGRPGDSAKVPVIVPSAPHDNNTNKYYAQPTTTSAPAPDRNKNIRRNTPRPQLTAVPPTVPLRVVLTLSVRGEIPEKRNQILSALHAGARQVTVTAVGEQLMELMRTDLELAVAREQITPDQFRDIALRFSDAPAVPVPPKTVRVPDEKPMTEQDMRKAVFGEDAPPAGIPPISEEKLKAPEIKTPVKEYVPKAVEPAKPATTKPPVQDLDVDG